MPSVRSCVIYSCRLSFWDTRRKLGSGWVSKNIYFIVPTRLPRSDAPYRRRTVLQDIGEYLTQVLEPSLSRKFLTD